MEVHLDLEKFPSVHMP